MKDEQKSTLNRPSHDPLPVERCPMCGCESAYHTPIGYHIRDDKTVCVFRCENDSCNYLFEGELEHDCIS